MSALSAFFQQYNLVIFLSLFAAHVALIAINFLFNGSVRLAHISVFILGGAFTIIGGTFWVWGIVTPFTAEMATHLRQMSLVVMAVMLFIQILIALENNSDYRAYQRRFAAR